ncbi:MAG: 5- methyltetrahydropteroyltriglutamate/homocysteine S-methyltransferase [Candidatus Methanoperedens nitroreducens]|uniref:5-methyltetrahydropteroyltriglutamate/homocysteine S-methyltransferase n=1 Tax=Candidatus Methanoperedens nitratireducens TaxID=1392998 RepID=A0A0N8KQZ7_9EURY|nr:methionine synthase [Candidatus Methanoperedens sp. BLZ2]KAB2946776.1 MAG: methionine synthase [Candidatus Methanoperedens sp.]KPQ43530.1 MAG: 5- methyltetrahydropteroyltriglutamate/homocysteine S-methyltransferase [Candidatus Methanoperedens sp. BLZ1]MBZ0175802.1 methionine synthase [Candidatus Methanoperedens nitroreducens]MCX9079260.1 methionine synthase [Candidatus Methanoperedens sp.]
MILFDDIGSFPLPKGINREWVEQAKKSNDPKLPDLLKGAMQQKIDAGVDVPTYPQFRDMNQMFLEIINDESAQEEPLIVRKDRARIMELSAMEDVGAQYLKKTGKKLNIRLCVTGPIELYMKQFGGTAYKDVLNAFAASIDRFVSNSIDNAKQFRIAVISIDEPSIGINPQIMFSDNDMIEALTLATKTSGSNKIDTEIHLHSPLHYKLICRVPSIGIIGVESAANPSYLDLIDKKDLEDYDKFLRIGVSRTDIFGMAAVLNEKYNTNVWKEPAKLDEITTQMETPQIIAKRLQKAYSIFGDRIKYAGPDCGLGSWSSQELASNLLKNTGAGIKEFQKNQ